MLKGLLEEIDVVITRGFGWCYKAKYNNKNIDLFFPEEQGGEYNHDDS